MVAVRDGLGEFASDESAGGLKMGLRRFALTAAAGFRGRGADEAFARALFESFGSDLAGDDAPVFGYTFTAALDGKKKKRSVTAYWRSRRLVVEVVARDLMLDLSWGELHRAVLQMDEPPQYVVLTNQRDVRLYDLSREGAFSSAFSSSFDRNAPRLTLALDELPKYAEAFPFLRAEFTPGTTPKIVNTSKVSKDVADLVAKVFRALCQNHVPEARDEDTEEQTALRTQRRIEVTRFTLQCIIAMFAEDIGLLPKEYFTTLLYRAAEEGEAEAKIHALFTLMSADHRDADGDSEEAHRAIPYFNGGLFTDPVVLPLSPIVLRALTRAAEANWTFVDPHIFGSVFQGIMDDAERHASGAHYTAREDIMSVVGPTIVEPWRERITAAKTLEDLRAILRDLGTYKVLDPACGSGNFLYVAFRELYVLETEVLVRMHEFTSVQSGLGAGWASVIRTTNFYGIDINPFAVELAKTTLNIAKKITFEERRATVMELYDQGFLEVDPSLPLDNLDENVRCEDALFCEWPEVDAIVGNPPFLNWGRLRQELGGKYLQRLKLEYPEGGGDLCALWFRRAHRRVRADGRVGLVATSAIRFGDARKCSLDHVLSAGGTITNAISSKEWPGDAMVNVSVTNWTRGEPSGLATLYIDDRRHHVERISAHLQLHADNSSARTLKKSGASFSEGFKLGSEGFQIEGLALHRVAQENAVRAMATGGDLLAGRPPRFTVWLANCASEHEAEQLSPTGFAYLRERVHPKIAERAADPESTSDWSTWLKRWWRPQKSRDSFRKRIGSLSRIVACSSPQSRNIFLFLSTKFVPTNTLQLFAYDDDYTFGIIQSGLHWEWVKAKGGRLKSDYRYTSAVWKTFPWPQAPTLGDVVAIGQAAQQLRATRDRLMTENGWSLRDLYRSAEVAGPHPLKEAQATLDAAVEAAYGKPADMEATEFLLEMNLALAEDEAAGTPIQGPGLPQVDGQALAPKDPRWFSTDCIEPPPLLTAEE